MPQVTLRINQTADGREAVLTEYICDWPNCPNVAEHVVGVLREIRAMSVLCSEHAKFLAARRSR